MADICKDPDVHKCPLPRLVWGGGNIWVLLNFNKKIYGNGKFFGS